MSERLLNPSLEQEQSPEINRPKFDVITISGHPGTGKTVVGEMLANHFEIGFIKIGEMLREYHRGRSGEEVTGYVERPEDVDQGLDQIQSEIIRNASPDNKTLLEGRLAHIIATEEILKAESEGKPRPNVLRILFTADEDVRAERVKDRIPGLTSAEAKAANADRERGDLVRWRAHHPLIPTDKDIYDPTRNEDGSHPFFDLIVDTSHLKKEETFEAIINWLESNNLLEDNLTADKATEIFYGSFRFSQGSPTLQRSMVQHIANKHPDWTMDNQLAEEVKKRFLQKAAKYLRVDSDINTKPLVHSNVGDLEALESETANRLAEFQEAINQVPGETDLYDITTTIIERDAKFLVDPNNYFPIGRPGERGQGEFLSHLCHYVMNRQPTGIEEFDDLFRDVYEHIGDTVLSYLSPENDGKLTKVIEYYNRFHPYGKKHPAFTSE